MTNQPHLSTTDRPDIEGRDDLRVLVDDFYSRVRADESLGFIFDDVAQVNWDTHLPKIVDFWETVLFRTGAYRGYPLPAHLDLSLRTEMDWGRFERWLSLFADTVDTHFAGDRAGHIKRAAADIANVMHRKIGELQSAAVD